MCILLVKQESASVTCLLYKLFQAESRFPAKSCSPELANRTHP